MTREQFVKKLVADFMDIYLKGIEGKTQEEAIKLLIEARVKEFANLIYGEV